MTTSARLLSTPADGHGLTPGINDPLFHALANDQPTHPLVAVVILNPVQQSGRNTAKGKHRFVSYEVIRLEPVLDTDQGNELRYLLQALYEQRTSTGDQQRTLPLALGKADEQRFALIERIEEWADEKGISGGQLEELWRDNFGAGSDDDWSFGDQGVPGDYRKATVAHLLSFGYSSGALSTDEPLPHEVREDDEEDDGDGTLRLVDDASESDGEAGLDE